MAGEFSSPELILCADSCSVSTAVARKRPWSFCQKCRWQVTPKYAYTHDPTKSGWADYAVVQACCENLSGNKLTCKFSGNTQPQSSQLAEPLWTDPGLKSGIKCARASTWKKERKKSAGRECMVKHSPQILASEENATIVRWDMMRLLRKTPSEIKWRCEHS